MAKYRISEITVQPSGEKMYLIEKRFLGFLWWYDPFDDGMYTDGYCNTYEKALERVNYHLNYKRNKKVVWSN